MAHLVWPRLGDVYNYVEPFAGSLAVLLRRPHAPRVETVNDIDCYVSNFWRATTAEPDAVAQWADWPVNEADLHSRHRWLVDQSEFRERMTTDPDYYDAKIAGWWVWGISQWIGSGWCSTPGWTGRTNAGMAARGIHKKRPQMKRGSMGVHGDAIREWFGALRLRLRHVRVCCGDWSRICGPSPTWTIGLTGVFLDPPYAVEDRDDVYSNESRTIAKDVAEWAREAGKNPLMRIALCGYEGEHDLSGWDVLEWKANGGYGNQAKADTRGRDNARRERIWFSPHCLPVTGQMKLIDEAVLK